MDETAVKEVGGAGRVSGRRRIQELEDSVRSLSDRILQMQVLVDERGRELRERTAELEDANQELEAFSYSVSHDLRAPLRSIDGFSALLLQDAGERLDPRSLENLCKVRAAAGRMGQLIDGLLRLSRVMRRELRRRPVDLSAMAATIAEALKAAEPDRRVEFIIAGRLADTGDAELLRVALENLLGNAWTYSSKNPVARIELGSTRSRERQAYFVRDNGAGFDMAYADNLFGAFQRLHSDGDFPGHGIGLATVQRIIRRHGGEIWAESTVGQGATFYFTLSRQA
jgi:light-regulated signal transduction histidine kinase (bacteriophytochrome)